LGVWIFGWDKLSKGLHAATIWLVAIGANISALWILIANSFMQQPVGYVLRNGRAEMTDFFALMLNPNVQVQFPHVFFAGLTTGAFFVMGISAYHLLRKHQADAFQKSFQLAAMIGTIAIVLTVLNGHTQAQHMVQTQPMKMASAEALWETENPASFSLLTIGDLSQRREVFSIRLPRLLSLLSYNQLTGEVKGIYDLQAEYEQTYGPGDYIPPVAVNYWTFRIMVGAGFLMAALALYGVFLATGDLLAHRPLALKIFLWAIALPYLANTSGWLLTELGRAPWAVFGLMKLDAALSPVTTVSSGEVLMTLVGFTLIYAALMVADVYLLNKFARAGIVAEETQGALGDQVPVFVGGQD
jgi:cytochrome d ubiquinol oxidase subunit I